MGQPWPDQARAGPGWGAGGAHGHPPGAPGQPNLAQPAQAQLITLGEKLPRWQLKSISQLFWGPRWRVLKMLVLGFAGHNFHVDFTELSTKKYEHPKLWPPPFWTNFEQAHLLFARLGGKCFQDLSGRMCQKKI